MEVPKNKPKRPFFSSGPCVKIPNWDLKLLDDALVSRSHRSVESVARMQELIDISRDIIKLPKDYKLAIMPASNTGAFEAALWNLIGSRACDVFVWDVFSEVWGVDVFEQGLLGKFHNVSNLYSSAFGSIPDLAKYNPKHDCVFVYNGTTSGVAVDDLSWIPNNREGLTICDATSGIFAYDLDWPKLDAVTWSWQKVLGSEASHGMLALSPRAIELIESQVIKRSLPKLFRITSNDLINQGLFEAKTLNTPSMLCVEDCLVSLKWIKKIGGLDAVMLMVRENAKVIFNWVERTPWLDFVAKDQRYRSITSIVIKVVDEKCKLSETELIKYLVDYLAKNNISFDIKNHAKGPVGFRIWAGATVEKQDLIYLTQWFDYAYAQLSD